MYLSLACVIIYVLPRSIHWNVSSQPLTKTGTVNNKYPSSKKLTIRDANGIRSVKINGKPVKIKKGKKIVSFKLSKYKKLLKKKGKWNQLVIIDRKGNKKAIRFKIKKS